MPTSNEVKLLGEREAAAFLSLSERTLQRYRVRGDGPVYLRFGKRRLAYAMGDLVAWMETCKFSSSAAEARASMARAA